MAAETLRVRGANHSANRERFAQPPGARLDQAALHVPLYLGLRKPVGGDVMCWRRAEMGYGDR
jgi:hypothetical protein